MKPLRLALLIMPLLFITSSLLRATFVPSVALSIGLVDFSDSTLALPVLKGEHGIIYPQDAAEEKVQGAVVVNAQIDATGRVTEFVVLQRSHDDQRLQNAVRQQLKNLQFRPAVRDGKPVECRVIISVLFAFSVPQGGSRSHEIPDVLPEGTPPTYSQEELAANQSYPKEALERGLEGEVYVQVTLSEKGKVVGVKVLKSSDTLFSDAAIAAVRKTTFTPATQNGYPVISKVTVRVAFRISDESPE